MQTHRIDALKHRLEKFGFDATLVIPGSTLLYLTGLSFHLMERPVFLLIPVERDPVMVLPELERSRMDDVGFSVEVLSYKEDDASRFAVLENAVGLIGAQAKKIAVEPLTLRFFELNLIQAAAPDWIFESGEKLFTALRIRKERTEIEHMQQAVRIAEAALRSTLPEIKIGMTERELAAELVIQLLRAGSDPELPFQPIVASGPNSALPHATPTRRKLIAGDLLMLDWGARSDGYISDITRTFAVGEIDSEYKRIHQIVLEANAAGREAVQPGVTSHFVDQAARQVIRDAGYGEYFFHRTGHGIGLEPHEPPNIRADDEYPLEPGMTFTIEPGVYLSGRAGVRIEDNVVVSEEGNSTLTSLPRALDIVG